MVPRHWNVKDVKKFNFISLFTQLPYRSEEHFYTYLLFFYYRVFIPYYTMGYHCQNQENDLTSDPTWVIGLYLVVTFSYIFMGETRTQKSRV